MIEHNSAFEGSDMDRVGWRTVKDCSPAIATMHERQVRNYGYSLAEDSYYALLGNTPKPGTALTKLWQNIQSGQNFNKLTPFLVDVYSTATTIEALANVLETKIRSAKEGNAQFQDQHGEGCRVQVTDQALDLDAKVENTILVDACLGTFLDEPTPLANRKQIEAIRNRYDLTNFAKILGWAKNVIGGESRKGKSTAGELTGYSNGGWGPNVHPRDMLGVARGDLQAKIKLVENQLAVRQFQADQPKGQGPVILLKDVSSSMNERDSGQAASRIQTANALELALATEFQKANRDLVSIAWSSYNTQQYVWGEPGLTDYALINPNGNTRIDRALELAIRSANEYVGNADMLIVSDGFIHHNLALTVEEQKAHYDKVLQPFRNAGGRVYALLLIPSADLHPVAANWGWVDGYVTVDALTDTHKMTDLLGAIARPRGNQNSKRVV